MYFKNIYLSILQNSNLRQYPKLCASRARLILRVVLLIGAAILYIIYRQAPSKSAKSI